MLVGGGTVSGRPFGRCSGVGPRQGLACTGTTTRLADRGLEAGGRQVEIGVPLGDFVGRFFPRPASAPATKRQWQSLCVLRCYLPFSLLGISWVRGDYLPGVHVTPPINFPSPLSTM